MSSAEYVHGETDGEASESGHKPLEQEIHTSDIVLRTLVERYKEVSRDEPLSYATERFRDYLCLHEHEETTRSEPDTSQDK